MSNTKKNKRITPEPITLDGSPGKPATSAWPQTIPSKPNTASPLPVDPDGFDLSPEASARSHEQADANLKSGKGK